MATATVAPRTTTAPQTNPFEAWVTVAYWVAVTAGFVGRVWIVAPARWVWSLRPVRVIAWLCLLPLVWWLVKVAARVVGAVVRVVVGPFVILGVQRFRVAARVRGSRARAARKAMRRIRKGFRRGRGTGARVASELYA